MSLNEAARVLSIQSHVVSGYVGNRSAVFPMQLLGLHVDYVNSVQFSNHTGYPAGAVGQILDAAQLQTLIEGLKANRLDKYDYLLTGYIGSESFLRCVANLVDDLRSTSCPDLQFICDPVMGDAGRMYVCESLLPVYREIILPKVDVLTPNQFELGLLTGVDVTDLASTARALNMLHEKGVSIVVLSSGQFESYGSNRLLCVGSRREETNKMYVIEIDKVAVDFTGTGDLFSALLLAWMSRLSAQRLDEILEITVSSIQAVLARTLELAEGRRDSASIELRLVEAQHCVSQPEITHRCRVVHIDG